MPKNNSKANRERRRLEADDRQADRDYRSHEDQLERLWTRAPGLASRERARLEANIEKEEQQ